MGGHTRSNTMMDTSNLNIFSAPLKDRVDQMKEALDVFVRDAHLQGVIVRGVMVFDDYVFWGVMYYPHCDPDEESIDVEAVISVKEAEKTATFSCRLMWSHGEVITSYLEDEHRTYRHLDELVAYVSQQWDRGCALFLADMKREMMIDRPPVYRVF